MTRTWAFCARKGGVSKSSCALATATLLAARHPDKQVALVVLDTNESAHERYVRAEDRRPLHAHDEDVEGPLWFLKPHKLDRAKTLNRLLNDRGSVRDLDGDTIASALYSRPDLPNLRVLFHVAGTLSALSRSLDDPATFKRLERIVGWLDSNADVIVVDTPADQELGIVRTFINLASLIIPVTDSTDGGANSLVDIVSMAMTYDVPVLSAVQSPAAPWVPDHGLDDDERRAMQRRVRGIPLYRREASETIATVCGLLGLELFAIPQDSLVPNTERDAGILPHAWDALPEWDRTRTRAVGDGQRAVPVLERFVEWLLAHSEDEVRSRWAGVIAAAEALRADAIGETEGAA